MARLNLIDPGNATGAAKQLLDVVWSSAAGDRARGGGGHGCDHRLAAHTAIGSMVGVDGGEVSDADVDVVRAAGFGDGEIAEIVANVALDVLTNYFNEVAETEIDFPLVSAGEATAAH